VRVSWEQHAEADRTVSAAAGELDVHTACNWRGCLVEPVAHGHRVIVDLAGLELIDSKGLTVLYGGLKPCAATATRASLRSCAPTAAPTPFRITGPASVFAIHDTVDQALPSLN
jgi:anti-anti-sigma factor